MLKPSRWDLGFLGFLNETLLGFRIPDLGFGILGLNANPVWDLGFGILGLTQTLLGFGIWDSWS